MRSVFLAATLAIAAAAPAPAAQSETWCLKSFGQERGACVFPSAQECAQAARFNAFGGVCEREALGKPHAKKHTSTR